MQLPRTFMKAPRTDDPASGAKPLEEAPNSSLMNVSVRGWLAIALVLTVCGMQAQGIKVEEPLYSLVLMAAGIYFGQSKKA